MKRLCNEKDTAQLLREISRETQQRVTVSFYRYVPIQDPVTLRDALYQAWNALNVLGRVYIAKEGINAQCSVPENRLKEFRATLEQRPEFAGVPLKFALGEGRSFLKLAIKVKSQIVADGLPDGSYDISRVGEHLSPAQFHAALDEPNVVVVDMRNRYESRIGRFENALCPEAETFREELPKMRTHLKKRQNKKILLYCTGGIRCEKASSYLLAAGFQKVYQLDGGIINYAHYIRDHRLPSKFRGRNFVFDGRMSERVTGDVLSNCDTCGSSCDEYRNCAYLPCNELFIQCPNCQERLAGCCSENCMSDCVFQLGVGKKQVVSRISGPS